MLATTGAGPPFEFGKDSPDKVTKRHNLTSVRVSAQRKMDIVLIGHL